MERIITISLVLIFSISAVAQNTTSSCLPVVQDAIAATKGLTSTLDNSNRLIEHALDDTVPGVKSSVDQLIALFIDRLSLGNVVGAFSLAALGILTVSLTCVWGGRFVYAKASTSEYLQTNWPRFHGFIQTQASPEDLALITHMETLIAQNKALSEQVRALVLAVTAMTEELRRVPEPN